MTLLTPAQRAALEWLPMDGVLISEIPGKHFDTTFGLGSEKKITYSTVVP